MTELIAEELFHNGIDYTTTDAWELAVAIAVHTASRLRHHTSDGSIE